MTNKTKQVSEQPPYRAVKTWHDGKPVYVAEQPAQQQEPVAWIYRGNLHPFDPSDWAEGPVTPLYTTPPRRDESNICRECAKYEARTFELERALRDAAYQCHEIYRRGGTAWDCWYELQAKGKG